MLNVVMVRQLVVVVVVVREIRSIANDCSFRRLAGLIVVVVGRVVNTSNQPEPVIEIQPTSCMALKLRR